MDIPDYCPNCDGPWHGGPTLNDDGQSCPGAWASEEAVAEWREMFDSASSPVSAVAPRAQPWRPASATAELLLSGREDRFAGDFKIALFRNGSNVESVKFYASATLEVPWGNGYATGGCSVVVTRTLPNTWELTSEAWWWASRGATLAFRYGGLYDPKDGLLIATFDLVGECADTHIPPGEAFGVQTDLLMSLQ